MPESSKMARLLRQAVVEVKKELTTQEMSEIEMAVVDVVVIA